MSTINTPKFRVSYPNVFEPKLNDLSGQMEYSIEAIFPEGTDITVLKEAAQKAWIKKFGVTCYIFVGYYISRYQETRFSCFYI